MATFKKADEIDVPQSVGPKTAGHLLLDEIFQVFQPKQGRDLTYKNPQLNDGSTGIEEEYDNRISLGTYTLNNRDSWENNNFNESTFQSYLNEEWEVLETAVLLTLDGDIVDRKSLLSNISPNFNYSIDALPFVINPKNNDIIHLDRYYDKDIDKENYELATEGKINYYLQPRIDGRLEQGNIDIFSERNKFTGGGGKNRFDFYISDDDRGYYLFKLNWGDGTEIEYTDKPKLLESTVLFEHFYEKPGFYSITGIVYVYDNSNIQNYEKFQTNILLNPSPNYELNLHDYNNFASIGGISKDSAFVKSLYNIVGINPLTQDNSRASEKVIEKLNEFDKILLLNVLGKVDSEVIQPYENLIEPYSRKITDDSLAPYEESNLIIINACADPNATNYYGSVLDGYVLIDDGSCLYTHTIGDWDFNLTATVDYGFIDLTWDNLTTDDINLFTTTSSEDWDIDWSTVVYRIQSRYHEENTGLTDWLDIENDGIVSYDTNTYNFNPNSPGYVEDREYNFRIQIQAPDADTDNIMESTWSEMEEEGIRTLTNEIGGLVNIIMSSTRDDNIDPAEGTTHILSTDIDDTYPNSLPIMADSEYGFEFQGWTIQPPNVVYIENPDALSTTIYWSNDENLLEQDIINVTVHAGYEEVQTDTGNPVNVGIYGAPAEYGGVSYPANFTLTSDNQTEDISANPADDDDEFTYSFDKWEVQSGEDYVGFGPYYVSETSVRNATLKWNNAGNPNDQNASVKAFFSREQITGGNGNGNGTCFLEGTMITMVDGTTKPIEQIQVGDEVMSYDDKTNKVTHNKVIQTMFHPPEPEHISYGVYLIINNNIKVTTNHAILADTNNRLSYDWPIADTLQVGDYLFDKDLNKIEITTIERVEEVVDTYNFEVENSHTYIAENVIVHNIGGDGPGSGKPGTKVAGGMTDDLTTYGDN